MCIFHSLENLFHVAAYIQGGGGITFCLQKGEPMRETAYWVGGEIFWATKGEAWERTNPCVWRNMIHNKTEESLEQRPLSDLGGNSRNWGWDITHVEEIWYIIKLNRVLNNRPLSDLGGNSRNWGWDISHMLKKYDILLKLNRVLYLRPLRTMEGCLKKGMGRGMLKYFNGFCSYYIYLVKFDIFFQKQRVGESRPGA